VSCTEPVVVCDALLAVETTQVVVDGTAQEVQPLDGFTLRQLALTSEKGDDGVAT
jgi:hypothetical protein